MIIIGLGSGRTGTASMAAMINRQKDAICFHELNPACAIHTGNPQSMLNTVNEFQRIIDGGDKRLLTVDYSRRRSVETYGELTERESNPKIMGDIAFYYINYVNEILAINPSVKFVCIRRDKQSTSDSWMEKTAIHRWRSLWLVDRIKAILTRTPFYTAKNHWQAHDGSEWQPDPVWDSCFPDFEARSKREAVEKYWDWYYQRAEKMADRYSDNFRIFDISALNNRDGQIQILEFCGLCRTDMVLSDSVHEHQSKKSKKG